MIAIIDYGMGNLRSVQKAFEYLGFDAKITDNCEQVLSADKVVLPGVGAFSDAINRLQCAGLDKVIFEVIKREKPFLGICLGMQLLFEKSSEGGSIVQGLNVLKGEIVKIPNFSGLKVPHIGWNSIGIKADPIFNGLKNEANVYFVHSYYLNETGRDYAIANTHYGCEMFVGVKKGKTYGLQFHPEKSGKIGLSILENFGGMS